MDAAQGEAAANRETLNELVHASRVDCCIEMEPIKPTYRTYSPPSICWSWQRTLQSSSTPSFAFLSTDRVLLLTQNLSM